MRTYTVRAQRPGEFDVDFALHGARRVGRFPSANAPEPRVRPPARSDHGGGGPAARGDGGGGPAARWALLAKPGDRAVALGPTEADNGGVDFRPPVDTDWVLLTGDETALPAIAGILTWLDPAVPARAWIEVASAADVQRLDTGPDVEVTRLVRPGAVLDAVRVARLPAGTPYGWIAGEASDVRALRRHLVGERGFDRSRVTFTGYWRRGASEEDLIAEAVAK